MHIEHKASAGDRGYRPGLVATLAAFAADESGSAAVDYALLCLIAMAIVVVIGQVGTGVVGLFTKVQNSFNP